MSARATKSLVFLSLIFVPSLSYASVSLNEVFYSPQSKSWIEVYNDTDSPIDLTKYKIIDSGAATNGHAISATGVSILDPHQYAIIAKDPTSVTTSALIFKSALGAKTTGDTISIKDDSGNISDTLTFTSSMGAAGDGNSLQKTAGGGWISASPTPGSTNATTASASVIAQDTSSSTPQTTQQNQGMTTAQQNIVASISTHYSYLPLSDFEASRDLEVSAGRPRLAAVGNPVEFTADTNQDNGSVIYEWSFGDGVIESNKIVRHIYQYPGDYAVVLNATSPSAKTIARTTIRIVNPDIFILDANSQYIEVRNDSVEEMNLYGWELRSGINTFTFPKDTIILPKQSIKFANALTHLSPVSFDTVVLAQSVTPGATGITARVPTLAERQKMLSPAPMTQKSVIPSSVVTRSTVTKPRLQPTLTASVLIAQRSATVT